MYLSLMFYFASMSLPSILCRFYIGIPNSFSLTEISMLILPSLVIMACFAFNFRQARRVSPRIFPTTHLKCCCGSSSTGFAIVFTCIVVCLCSRSSVPVYPQAFFLLSKQASVDRHFFCDVVALQPTLLLRTRR